MGTNKDPKSIFLHGIDQCHKQLNTIVKGDGGALGITEDEEKFRKWMVCGPEIARMVKEFEHVTILKDEDTQFRHHEDTLTKAVQQSLCKFDERI